MSKVTLQRMSLGQLFEEPLRIPDYQRTYSWRGRHVLDLLKDIFGRTTPYLLGTVILHNDKDQEGNSVMDLVDGQQRLVTLTILCHTLNIRLKQVANSAPNSLMKGEFTRSSAWFIRNTLKIITGFIEEKNDDELKPFYDLLFAKTNENIGLLFDVLVLKGENALDQAYTFFDSVNSKGKELTDFNLLKAHHLMYIPSWQEGLAIKHNDEWQRGDANHSQVFTTTLRRLRMWAKNKERDNKQERPDYNEFCPVVTPEHDPDNEHMFNRYMQPVAFRSWRRIGDKIVLSMDYPALDGEELIPTEVTQTIEGGDAFFLYAKRYHRLFDGLFPKRTGELDSSSVSTAVAFARKIANCIVNEKLQNAFRALILLYVDKFGEDRLIDVCVLTERIISSRRWAPERLQLEGALSHVKNKQLVPILLNSVSTLHVYLQLLATVPTLLKVPCIKECKGVRKDYLISIKQFYLLEESKIFDKNAKSIANSYLTLESMES